MRTFVNFGPIEAIEDGVEHDLGIVAIGIEFGTESIRVGDDTGVFANDGVRSWIRDFHPALGHPGTL